MKTFLLAARLRSRPGVLTVTIGDLESDRSRAGADSLTSMRAILAFPLLLLACSSPTRIYESGPVDSGADTTGDTSMDAPSMPGEVGAPCTNNDQCVSKFCLDIGRCSRACPTAGLCPNSSNWTCLAVPMRGPMCVCDVIAMTDVACNGLDDNCDGKIDEDSPTCGGKCVDTKTDNNNCGGCARVCGAGSTCVEGACKCGVEKPDRCGTSCVDVKTDAAHCGACDKVCATGEVCALGACGSPTAVDVTVLLDVTGSNLGQLNTIKGTLNARLVAPLLKIADVQVGVSYTAEFPIAPYGMMGDQPFRGGIEPTATESMITPLINMFPNMMGGDEGDGMVEGLATLSGLGVHPMSTALSCSMGRVAGGCWRSGAKKVIVLVTDSLFHNAPDPAAPMTLVVPYMGITPPPKDWPAVLKAMTTQKITLLFMNTAYMSTPPPKQLQQWELLLKDLGQPITDVYPSYGDPAAMTASDNVVKRIAAIKASP